MAETVTASSAVPIEFRTVRCRNYAGTYGFEPPSWTRGPAQDGNELRNMLREELVSHAEGGEGREFIHLLDGGLSDNLGLANSVAVFARISDPEQAFRRLGHEDLELILVVTVNAEGRDERSWDGLNRSASAVQVVSGLSNAQIKQNNHLTVKLARMALGGLARDLSTPERPVHFRHIELSFSKLANSEQRDFLSGIETSFNLSDKKVDRLIEAGRRVVRDSRELAEALALVDEVRDGLSGRSP